MHSFASELSIRSPAYSGLTGISCLRCEVCKCNEKRLRVARTQLEHNKRLVNEGQLAPIDVVAAEAQISTYEQRVFSALEEVSRSENNLKNLIAENQKAAIWTESLVPSDPVDLAVPDVSLAGCIENGDGQPARVAAVERASRDQSDRSALFQRTNKARRGSGRNVRHKRSGWVGQHCWRESVYCFEFAGATSRR